MKYLVVVHCDLSGWVEARPIRNLTSKVVARFVWKDIICRHGCFRKLVVDDGSEIKDAVPEVALWYWIKKEVVSAYHPQTSGIIEQGYKSLVDNLAKTSERGLINWVQKLPAVLWADKLTVWTSIRLTSYYLNCESELVFSLNWKIQPGVYYHKIKSIQSPNYWPCELDSYSVKTKIWKKPYYIYNKCVLKERRVMIRRTVFGVQNQ